MKGREAAVVLFFVSFPFTKSLQMRFKNCSKFPMEYPTSVWTRSESRRKRRRKEEALSMEDIVFGIWSGLPSVQATTEAEAKRSTVISSEEADNVLRAVFKACHRNCTPADATAGAVAARAACPSETLSFQWFVDAIVNYVAKNWLNVDSNEGAAPAAAATAAAGDENRPVTPQEAALKEVAECVLDDRDPCLLLPFADVLTLGNSRAKTLYSSLSTFLNFTVHAQIPAVYTQMWSTAVHGESALTLPRFTRWFQWVLLALFENANPERAAIAARKEWYDLIAPTGIMSQQVFVRGAEYVAEAYAGVKGSQIPSFYETLVQLSEAERKKSGGSVSGDLYDALVTLPGREQALLADPWAIQCRDELDSAVFEERFFRKPQGNSTIIVGKQGTAKSVIASELAKKINGVNIDIEALAVAAFSDPADEVGDVLRQHVADFKPVPLTVQAQLVRRVLLSEGTRHRGYVFADIPTATEHNKDRVEEFLVSAGLLESLPQAVVEVECPLTLYSTWSVKALEAKDSVYQQELALRAQEQEAHDKKIADDLAAQARKIHRQQRIERRAKIEAGEIQPTEQDQLDMQQPIEEEEEVKPEVDDEGNPLDPEVLAQREEQRRKLRETRMRTEDLKHLVYQGRRVLPTAAQVSVTSFPKLAQIVEVADARHRVVRVGCVGSAVDSADYIMNELKLSFATVPTEPTIPDDADAPAEGPAESDIQLAEIKLKALTENSQNSFSKWQKYCSVTYADEGVLVEGSMAYSCLYRSAIYCFASRSKLNRFKASPHTFLVQKFAVQQPVIIFKANLDVTTQGGLVPSAAEEALAKQLGLTSIASGEFYKSFIAYRDLGIARKQAEDSRAISDAKIRLAREERLKKRLEAEAKRRKKEDSKKKPEKKKKEEGEAAGGQEGDAPPEDAAPPPPPVETTEQRMEKVIRAAVAQRDDSLAPLLVSCLSDISEEQFDTLFDERALPPTVLLLTHKKPRPPGEEGEEEEAPAEEEEAAPPAAEEEGEDGAVAVKKVAVKPPFDPTDDKQYRRLVAKLVAKLTKSSEQFGSEPEAVEGQPPPKPYQKFNILTFNTFGKAMESLVADIVHALHPASTPALPPQDGEEIAQDADPEDDEDGNRKNPLLVPGAKAIHQFGKVLRYCPVTLSETGTLVTGDPANWVSYYGKKYLFVSADALEKFKQNPRRYLENPALPPPRIWVVGPPSSGKKVLSSTLAAEYSLPIFQYGLDAFKQLVEVADAGGNFADTKIPKDAGTDALQRAKNLLKELALFDADQQEKLALKEQTQKEQADREAAREAGEDVEDLDEEEEAAVQKATEFEPEEAEAKEERVSKATRQIAASLVRIEPYNSRGYILVGHPNSEGELQTLLDEGAFPDIVVNIKLSTEIFVSRRIKATLAAKYAEHREKVAAQQEKLRSIQIKQREIELAKWRRRNIGGEDAAADEVDEPPEEVEPVNEDAVKADLESTFDTENGTVAAVVGLLPERRIQVADLNGDAGREAVYKSCLEQLRPFLDSRRSLFCAVQVATFDESMSSLRTGAKVLSSFRFHDPVALFDARQNIPLSLSTKQNGECETREDEIPPPEPVKPKEKQKRIVTKVNEETGEEYQAEEEVEEEAPEADEPEPEEELEAEPENSPEELEEMQKELLEKQKARDDALKPRVGILGNRVYFFESESNLLRFLSNPLKFWDQPCPGDNMPVIVSVFEDQPNSFDVVNGVVSRTMSEQIAANMNIKVLDIPRLLKWALLQPRLGVYCTKAREFLTQRVQFNNEVINTLLVARLQCADVRRRGIVLADLPRNAAHLKALTDSKIYINNAFSFRSSDAMMPEIAQISDVCHGITAAPGSMVALVECLKHVEKSRLARQEQRLRVDLGFPAPTYNTTTLESTIADNLSKFAWYCPHMWSHKQELVDLRKNRQFCVVFCGKYYSFSTQEYLNDFLVHPETVASDWNGRGQKRLKFLQLPSTLPRHLSAVEAAPFIGQLELAGCCPVTLYDTRHNVGLKGITDPTAVKGKPHLVSEYASKYYALHSEATMDRFLKQPWVFADGAVLPHENKLPIDDQTLRDAPDDVFLTRAVYENAARAMLLAAKTRPKYPGLSIEESALKFIALHLKAHNTKNSDVRQQQYSENFKAFAQQSVLYKSISTTEPDDMAAKEEFHRLCHQWDHVQDEPTGFLRYNELRTDSDASVASSHH